MELQMDIGDVTVMSGEVETTEITVTVDGLPFQYNAEAQAWDAVAEASEGDAQDTEAAPPPKRGPLKSVAAEATEAAEGDEFMRISFDGEFLRLRVGLAQAEAAEGEAEAETEAAAETEAEAQVEYVSDGFNRLDLDSEGFLRYRAAA